MNWKSLVVAVAGVAVIASAATWQIQAWRWSAKLAAQTVRHAQELTVTEQTLSQIKEEATRQLVSHQEAQRALTQQLAALDTKHYQEMRRAQIENARLRDDLAVGRKRLSVPLAGHTNNNSCTVPGVPCAPGVDDGTLRAELHPEVAGRAVRIAGEANECAIKLTALQQWIRAQK